MSILSSCVSKIVNNNNCFCRLCLQTVAENCIHVEDEVILNRRDDAEEMSVMISTVLGAQFAENITVHDAMCNSCTQTVIKCYKFIKMCRYNSEQLINAVDILNDCLEYGPNLDILNKSNTLFISLDTAELSSQQLYDTSKSKDTKTALNNFSSILRRTKKDKRKALKFNDETLKICDVIREDHKPTIYKCKVCSNESNKLFNMKKHYYSQHSEKIHNCTQCNKSYGSEALLKQHVYDCHSNMICTKCGKEYKNRYSLLYHMRCHTGEQPYECKFCGAKFHWSSRRAEHIRRYHKEPEAECDICHMKFRTLGSLYEHRKRHFNPNSRLHVIETVECMAESELSQSQKGVNVICS